MSFCTWQQQQQQKQYRQAFPLKQDETSAFFLLFFLSCNATRTTFHCLNRLVEHCNSDNSSVLSMLFSFFSRSNSVNQLIESDIYIDNRSQLIRVFMYIIFWNVIFLDFRIKVFWIKCKDINFEWNTFRSQLMRWSNVHILKWKWFFSFIITFSERIVFGLNGQSLQN